MSALAIAALVLVCVWLGVLSFVVVLLVRQIGLLTVRLSVAGQALSLDNDGPEVGSKVPDEVASVLPNPEEGRAYLLLVSATCAPCRQLVADIGERHFEQAIVALVPGSEQVAGGLASLLPSGIQAVLDPDASRLAEAHKIHSTPFALETANGTVTRISYLYAGAPDLTEFVEAKNAAIKPSRTVQVATGEAVGRE